VSKATLVKERSGIINQLFDFQKKTLNKLSASPQPVEGEIDCEISLTFFSQ
jgi:hypothetical protein